MTDEQKENTEVTVVKKRRKFHLNLRLVDNIAEKLILDLSLSQIAKKYQWSPNYTTLRKWERVYPWVATKWAEARGINLEARRKDRITELKNMNLEAIMDRCAAKTHLTANQKEALFKAMVARRKEEIEWIYKELAIEMREKYGAKVEQTVNFNDEARSQTVNELQVNIQDMLVQVIQSGQMHMLPQILKTLPGFTKEELKSIQESK